MSILICLPLPQEYIDIGERVIEEIQNPNARPLQEDIERAADLLIETVLEVMIIQMIETVEMKPFAKKVVTQLGHLVEKLAGVLMTKVISKMSNQEVRPLVEYLNSMEYDIDGIRHLAYELDARSEHSLQRGYLAMEEGNSDSAREHLIDALAGAIDLGALVFYKQPMDLLKLGFVARKVVDLGYTTLIKAIRPAIHKIGEHMEHEEIKSLRAYVDNLVVEFE